MNQTYELHTKRNEILTEVYIIDRWLTEEQAKHIENVMKNAGTIAYLDVLLENIGVKILAIKSIYTIKV